MRPLILDRDDERLTGLVGGSGSPSVLLLHGLAGEAAEWSETALRLGEHHMVVALDARGHGAGGPSSGELSRAAHAADAAYVIEQLELLPCVVVGQSLGGLPAMLLAAARPDLVRGLVVVEAMPMAPDREAARRIRHWIESWEEPSPALADAVIRTVEEDLGGSFWKEWGSISVPTLIVAGEQGTLPATAVTRMLALVPAARFAQIPGAGHDLHLETTEEWVRLLERFLEEIA
jgi:pimeloyl-ACP methyl ester carboxylesterase